VVSIAEMYCGHMTLGANPARQTGNW